MLIRRMSFMILATSTVVLAPIVAAHAGPWRTPGMQPAAIPRLGPEVQISVPQYPECQRYRADVAFNWSHDEYMVVWHQTWDDGTRQVYARRMSTSGQPVAAPFRVTTMSGNEVHPAVAYNASNDEYLLVWMYDVSGDGTRYDIRGRIIPWNPAGGGSDVFVIGNWVHPYDMWNPSVAWGAVHNAYLVTWDAYDAATRQPLRLGSRVVSADGAPDPSATITSADSPHHSDLIYNAARDEFLVVWVRSLTNIYGARLNWDGTVARSDFAIHSASTTQQYPAVTTNEQNRYMVAWEHQYSATDWDVLGIELNVDGDQVAPFFVIASTGDARPGRRRDVLEQPGAGRGRRHPRLPHRVRGPGRGPHQVPAHLRAYVVAGGCVSPAHHTKWVA